MMLICGEKAKIEFEKRARPFVGKSLFEKTRRAYGCVIKDFLTFHRNVEPIEIAPLDVAA